MRFSAPENFGLLIHQSAFSLGLAAQAAETLMFFLNFSPSPNT
jgi:hypothetical protein